MHTFITISHIYHIYTVHYTHIFPPRDIDLRVSCVFLTYIHWKAVNVSMIRLRLPSDGGRREATSYAFKISFLEGQPIKNTPWIFKTV